MDFKSIISFDIINSSEHDKESKHSFPCDICNKSFELITNLKKHMKSTHQDFKHPCDQCEYNTAEKGNLKRHMRTKHEGVRFPCDQCEYSGSTKHKVKIHNISEVNSSNQNNTMAASYKSITLKS